MPDQVTRAEFAASVKVKYPAYAKVPDDALVTRMLEKYPVYRDRIRSDASSTPSRDWSAQLGLHAPTANRAVGFVRGAGTAAVDLLEGAASGAASTMYHGGDLIRRAIGIDRVLDTPQAQEAMRAPDSFAGHAGRFVEQGAEFAVPLTRVSRAMQGAGLVRRALVEGAASAGVAGVQSGGEPGTMAVAGASGAVLPFAAKVGGATFRATQRAAAGAKEGGVGGAIAGAVRTVAPGAPRTMLIQALKPRNALTHFPHALDRALPEIKAAESVLGKPIETIDELLTATKTAKQHIQTQLNQMRGSQRAIGAEVDLSSVADSMVTSIPKKLRLENPRMAQRLEKAASVYRRSFTLDEAETLLRETNAELDGLYDMFPGKKHALLTSNPMAASLDAQAKTLRTAIYNKLDDPGAGAAARELNRRYGALMEVEDVAFRRSNVATRQQPESLSEQIGAVRAAGDMARGAWKLAHMDLSGAADIAAGAAGRSTAKAIKDSQTTNALIKRALAGYKGQAAPIVMPQARPVRGLLMAGARRAGPGPDASFVRGVPAQPAISGTPRQLPPGRTVRPMPGDVAPVMPDASRVGSVKAAPIDYAIDPHLTVKAGGFRVAQFSGDPAAAKAAVAAPPVRSMLQRMADDLNTFAPQRGRLVQENLDDSATHYAPGVAGSPVGDDIRTISEEHVGNDEIVKAIQDLLAGKTPTNKLHTAALDAAMGYLEKRRGYRGPLIPAGWGDEVADDGFEAFSRAIDDVSGNRR